MLIKVLQGQNEERGWQLSQFAWDAQWQHWKPYVEGNLPRREKVQVLFMGTEGQETVQNNGAA